MSIEKKYVYVRMPEGGDIPVTGSRKNRILEALAVVEPSGVEDRGDAYLIHASEFYIPQNVSENHVAEDEALPPCYGWDYSRNLSEVMKSNNPREAADHIVAATSAYAKRAYFLRTYREWVKTSTEAAESRRKAAFFEQAWDSFFAKIRPFKDEIDYSRPEIFAHYELDDDSDSYRRPIHGLCPENDLSTLDRFDDCQKPLTLIHHECGLWDEIMADTTDAQIVEIAENCFDWNRFEEVSWVPDEDETIPADQIPEGSRVAWLCVIYMPSERYYVSDSDEAWNGGSTYDTVSGAIDQANLEWCDYVMINANRAYIVKKPRDDEL